LLPDLTDARIVQYMKALTTEKAAGRTVNAELGELACALERTWKGLRPRVKELDKRHDIGNALTPDQEQALMGAADWLAGGKVTKDFKRGGQVHQQSIGPRGVMLPTLIRLALLTGMRAEELTSLRWSQVNLEAKTITVGKAKTAAGAGRIMPMGATVYAAMRKQLVWWVKRFGEAEPDLCVFPFGNSPSDPTRPITTLKHSWESVRAEAKVECRWHDLGHSFCTKLAEQGVSESTILAPMGHMSRRMLEKSSHISMAAKREAVEGPTVGTASTSSDAVPTIPPTKAKRAALQQPVIH
jgi:integrase